MSVTLGVNIKQNKQYIEGNKSNVTVSVYCKWTGWSYNIQEIIIGVPSATGWLEIDGEKYDFRSTFNDDLTETGTKTLFTKTLDVYHDVAGKKTISCSAYYETGVSSGNITAEKTLRLTDIPRYAEIKKASGFNDESDPKITYANPAGSSVSSLQAGIKLEDGTIVADFRSDISKTGTNYTFKLTDTERDALRKATPNSNTLKVVFCVKSKIGSTTQESTLEGAMSIIDANPKLSPEIVDTNSATINVTGDRTILVAQHSKAKVTLNAVAQKYATVKSKRIENGTTVLKDDGTFTVKNNPIKIKVVDSRGNATDKTAGNTIVPYINPTCSIGNNIPEADGSFELEATGLFYNGAIGKTTNELTVQYRFREGYGEYSEWVAISKVIKEENSYAAAESLTGLDYKRSYTFQMRVIDSINADGIVSAEKTVIAEPAFDWSKEDFNFNVPVRMKSGSTVEAQPNGEQGYIVKKTVNAEEKQLKIYINSAGLPTIELLEDEENINNIALDRDKTIFANPIDFSGDGVKAAVRENLGVGTNKVFNKLTDIGITTFPTTMKTVANAMPNNSTLMLDSRDIIAGGQYEISNLGIGNAGVYMFMRGNSNARLSLLHIYGATGATTSYMNFGCYAATNNEVVWSLGERQNANYPDCRYRVAADGNTEWINPPMLPGTEYRTTERWNGKPVYKKLLTWKITSGIAGVARYEIAHGVTNMDSASLRVEWTTKEWTLPHVNATESLYVSGVDAAQNSTKLVVKSDGNANWGAGRTFYFFLTYCKT